MYVNHAHSRKGTTSPRYPPGRRPRKADDAVRLRPNLVLGHPERGVIGIRKVLWTALLVILVASLAIPLIPIAAEGTETEKAVILGTYKLTQLSSYMLDTSTNKLLDLNASVVKLADYEMQDINTSDSYVPSIVINLSSPTVDLNTNEKIAYMWAFASAAGSIAIGVGNIVNNTIENATFVKITASGDVAVYRTNYDVVVVAGNVKFSLPNSDVAIIYTDGTLAVQAINYIELRALSDTPQGYTLIRSGNSETTFTISVTGSVSVWFDEAHGSGDMDLAIFDQSNPSYNDASNSQSWEWLMSHATAFLWSDTHPRATTVEATGALKFVVKRYNGADQDWRVAVRVLSGDTPTQTPTPSETPAPTPNCETSQNWLDQIQGIFESGSNTAILVIAALLFIVVLVIALRK